MRASVAYKGSMRESGIVAEIGVQGGGMKIGTGIGGWLTGIGDGARKAEEQGYDFVTCGELSHDSMLTMTVAATATQRIELLTGVTIAFPRSPMVLAMEAWDLQHYTKGPLLDRARQSGEGPQRAPLRRHVERAGAADEGIHPDDEGRVGQLAERHEA